MVDREGFEPSKAVGRQIYSLLPLTTRAPVHVFHILVSLMGGLIFHEGHIRVNQTFNYSKMVRRSSGSLVYTA
jgi:hypothetical protein